MTFRIKDPRMTAIAATVAAATVGGGELLRERRQVKKGKRNEVSKKRVVVTALTAATAVVGATTAFGQSETSIAERVAGKLNQLRGEGGFWNRRSRGDDDLLLNAVATPPGVTTSLFMVPPNRFAPDHPLHLVAEQVAGRELSFNQLCEVIKRHFSSLSESQIRDFVVKLDPKAIKWSSFPGVDTSEFQGLVSEAVHNAVNALLNPG